MTNPTYQRIVNQAQKDLDSNIVILDSIDRWGIPTVVSATHPSERGVLLVQAAVDDIKGQILDIVCDRIYSVMG